MLESQIEHEVVFKARNAGWFVRKVAWIGRKSAPDRVFAKAGRTVWIEFKRPGEKPDELQKREHDRMREAGMEVHVCASTRSALILLGLYG